MRAWLWRWLLGVKGVRVLGFEPGDILVVYTDLPADRTLDVADQITRTYKGPVLVVPKGWDLERLVQAKVALIQQASGPLRD